MICNSNFLQANVMKFTKKKVYWFKNKTLRRNKNWYDKHTWIGWRLFGLEGSGPATTVISCWPRVDWFCWVLGTPLLLEVVTTTTLDFASTPTCTPLPPLFAAPAEAARVYWAPVVVMAIAPSLLSETVVSPPPPCFWMDDSEICRYSYVIP